ncbi:MAG: hypothetical protein JWM16_2902 [Verrucomicrobiales bacterium]|nr:hypothetical protein [Verrucomicrobiales bacterium]
MKTIILILTIGYVALQSSFAKPQPRYHFYDLGTLPGGTVSQAIKINNRNEIVGVSETADGRIHAFIWSDGVMQDLGVQPGATESNAYDINDNGQIIGSFPNAYSGAPPIVAPIGYQIAGVVALNNKGALVGKLISDVDSRILSSAYIYENSSLTLLPPLSFGGSAEAMDINNLGEVVGISEAAQNQTHPVMWSDGIATDLRTFPGLAMSQPTGINDLSHICGVAEVALTNQLGGYIGNFTHACLLRDGYVHDLGTLSGAENSNAYAVNNFDEVIGICVTKDGVQTALFLYSGGTMYDLGPLIAPQHRWNYILPSDINDNGWIVGMTDRHAFLLKPVDKQKN